MEARPRSAAGAVSHSPPLPRALDFLIIKILQRSETRGSDVARELHRRSDKMPQVGEGLALCRAPAPDVPGIDGRREGPRTTTVARISNVDGG